MTFKFIIVPKLQALFTKIGKKDKVLAIAIDKKIKQVIAYDKISILHLKNLRHDSSEYKRVQVGSFILFFRLEGDTVIFERFKHHDDAYKR